MHAHARAHQLPDAPDEECEVRVRICPALFALLVAAGITAACGDGTGPSGGDGSDVWAAASGRYRLTYMSGAQPPWRYVDPGSSIGTDVDSVMLRLHPDGNYDITFYLHGVTNRPTYNGYWSPTDTRLTFLPKGKGSLTTGSFTDDKASISPVAPLMPGLAFPNGPTTAFEFERAGKDTHVVDSFIQARLLADIGFTGVAVTADGMIVAVASVEKAFVRATLPFQMPPPVTDGGGQPLDIALAAGDAVAFVAEGGAGELGIFDVATGQRTGTVTIRRDVIRVLAGGNAIFALTNDEFGRDSLFRIDAVSHEVTARVSVQAGAIAVSDDGSRVYAGSGAGVQELDGATLDSLRTLSIPATGRAMALSQNGATLYIGPNGNAIEAWDLATVTRTLRISVTGGIYDIARQPGTGQLYVSRSQNTGAGSVYRINLADPADESEYNTGGLPRRIAFTSSGNPVVANDFGWIDVLR